MSGFHFNFPSLTASEGSSAGLWLGLGLGTAFSMRQVAKGAHLMSHNLWVVATDLWTAALVFSPLMAPGRASSLHANSVPAESQP